MKYETIRPVSHEEWLAARTNGIGASEAAAVLGKSPYCTAYQLWQQKRAERSGGATEEKNLAFDIGHTLEPLVVEQFAAKTGAVIDPESVGDWIAYNPERPCLRVSPDRLYTLDGQQCVLECKTTRIGIDTDDLPVQYIIQLMYQMHVLGVERGALAWIDTTRAKFDYTFIDYSPEFGKVIEDEVVRFWCDYIVGAKIPSAACPTDILDRFPMATATEVEANAEICTVLDELTALNYELKEMNARKEALTSRLQNYMGTNERLTYRGEIVAVWKNVNGAARFDSKRFKAEHADIYEQYITQTAATRRFTLK